MFHTLSFSSFYRFPFTIRWYAGAVKAKAATIPKNKAAANATASAKKQKQTLSTRKKKTTLSSSTDSTGSLAKLMTSDKSGPFKAALFTVDPEHEAKYKALQADAHECYHRFVIEKAVFRSQELEGERRAHDERSLVKNKMLALEALQKISPTLWQKAMTAPQPLPPSNRRLPTESSPTKQPFFEDESTKYH